MPRALAILLTTAVITTAVVPSAFACVRDYAAVGSQGDHDCCRAQIVAPASAAMCCVLSQPARDRAVTVSPTFRSNDGHLAVSIGPAACRTLGDAHRPPDGGRASPSHATSAVPIYLQQRSLLI